MGKSFKRIVASSVGSFGENTEKIPQWIRANGGTYSKDVDSSVTHLIASEAAVKKNFDPIKKAQRFKDIKIVDYSWLEDSLLSKSRCPKRAGPYLWDRIVKEQREKAKSTQKDTKGQAAARQKKQRGVDRERTLGEFFKGARAIVSEMESLGYHLYVDKASGTSYITTLTRSSIINGRERKEKFLTKLYESNAKPHTYATFVKYSRVGGSSKDILSPRGSSFDLELNIFKKFFEIKTGRAWDDRHDDSKIPDPKRDEEGELVPLHEAWYNFEQPTGLMASLDVAAEMMKARDDKTQAETPLPGSLDAGEPQTCNESVQDQESSSVISPKDEDIRMAGEFDDDVDQDSSDAEFR